MRQVTPQKPHRSSVSTSTSKMSLTKSSLASGRPDRPPSQDERTYPAGALAAMLVIGVVLGLLLAALISAFLGGGSSSDRPNGSASPSARASGSNGQSGLDSTQRSDQIRTPPENDVRVYACGVDADGYASARVLITNGGNDSATYHVRVIFASASDGNIISDDVASVKNLAPGTSAPLQSVDAVNRTNGDVVCRLGSVSRFDAAASGSPQVR